MSGDCDGLHGRAVVGHDHQGDGLACGGIDAVLDEPVPQQRIDGLDSGLQCGDEVCGAEGGRDRAGQRGLGGVVDHRTEPPGALGGDLELGEVRLPHPAAAHRCLHEGLPARLSELAALGLVVPRLQQAPRAMARLTLEAEFTLQPPAAATAAILR